MKNNHIIGVFHEESYLIKALHKLKGENIKIRDIHGPCADHGVLRTLTPESRFSYFSLVVGVFALLGTFAAVYYITVIDYPMNFGGKPFFSFPPMVIVLFLVTILVTGVVSTLAFLALMRMFPGKPNTADLPGSLDDRYYLVLDKKANHSQVKDWLKESGAEKIIDNNIDE